MHGSLPSQYLPNMLFDGLVHWKVQDSTSMQQTIVVEFIGYMKPQAKLLLNVTKLQKHQLGALEIIHTLFWELSSLGKFLFKEPSGKSGKSSTFLNYRTIVPVQTIQHVRLPTQSKEYTQMILLMAIQIPKCSHLRPLVCPIYCLTFQWVWYILSG